MHAWWSPIIPKPWACHLYSQDSINCVKCVFQETFIYLYSVKVNDSSVFFRTCFKIIVSILRCWRNTVHEDTVAYRKEWFVTKKRRQKREELMSSSSALRCYKLHKTWPNNTLQSALEQPLNHVVRGNLLSLEWFFLRLGKEMVNLRIISLCLKIRRYKITFY